MSDKEIKLLPAFVIETTGKETEEIQLFLFSQNCYWKGKDSNQVYYPSEGIHVLTNITTDEDHSLVLRNVMWAKSPYEHKLEQKVITSVSELKRVLGMTPYIFEQLDVL